MAPLENTVFYYAHSNLWLTAKRHGDFTIDGHPGRRPKRWMVVCAVRASFFLS
jgi:hypothetical protein